MSGTTMAFAIVAIVMVAGIINKWLGTRAKEADLKAQGLGAEAEARIDTLEKRVQVLERIATDKGARLKEEIDAL